MFRSGRGPDQPSESSPLGSAVPSTVCLRRIRSSSNFLPSPAFTIQLSSPPTTGGSSPSSVQVIWVPPSTVCRVIEPWPFSVADWIALVFAMLLPAVLSLVLVPQGSEGNLLGAPMSIFLDTVTASNNVMGNASDGWLKPAGLLDSKPPNHSPVTDRPDFSPSAVPDPARVRYGISTVAVAASDKVT